MSIQQTELITLNGNNSAFGGRIYGANYQIGFNESVSTVNLNVINANGNYNISEEDLRGLNGAADTISFGGKSLKMYPVSYTIDKGESGKVLAVKYVDASQKYLDKKFVVLKGTHIANKSNSPDDALMTVGESYWSQEVEIGDGTYAQNLVTTAPNITDLPKSFYYVSELYSVMEEHGIPMHESVRNILLNKEGSSTYLNNIVGTLRNTLLAWANIMAFAFYWGEDNKLHFIDLEENLVVKTEKLDSIIPLTDSENYSIEDTVDRGFALYYGKAGTINTTEQSPFVSSFFFRRGIQDYDSQTELSYQGANKLLFIKASLFGETFFTAYSLWAISQSIQSGGNVDASALGISNPQLVTDQTLIDYIDPDNVYTGNNPSGGTEYGFIKYTPVDTEYDYSYFRALADKLLTYEIAMRKSDFVNYSSWDKNFTYDSDGNSEFINSNNGQVDEDSDDPKYRAFFTIGIEEGFDLGEARNFPKEIAIPVDFIDNSEAAGKGVANTERVIAIIAGSGAFFSQVNNIRYRYVSKQKLTVRGYKPRPPYSYTTPRLEKIFTQKPSYYSNTIATDMQLESGSENTIAFAGASFENLADILNESYVRDGKTFTKTFSISGITLPEPISPEDGLQSISISSSSDRGVVSTYTVGNTLFKIPSKDIILQKLEREKYAQNKGKSNRVVIKFKYY